MKKQKVEKKKWKKRKEENEDQYYEDENEYKNEDDDYKNEYENEVDDETMTQNKKNKMKDLNDNLDEIIDKSKLFEEQIESLKKLEGLKGYLFSIFLIKVIMIKSWNLNSLKYNWQTCQMKFTKSYLNKYLVMHL